MKLKVNWIIVSIFMVAYLLSISHPLLSMELEPIPGMEDDMDTGSELSREDDPTEPDYSEIDPLDDESLKSIDIRGWLDRPMLSKDFYYLTNKFIEYSCGMYQGSQWLYDNRADSRIRNILEWNFGGETELKTSVLPCIARLIVPPNTRLEIIGDIHGNMDTMDGIFDSLKNKNLINEFMYMPDDTRIIFLGDYTDRGDFNLQVLAAVLILSAKNPGKVFLLKGNHELDIIKQTSAALDEIEEIASAEKVAKKILQVNVVSKNTLISNLIKVYNLMPVAMFIGFDGQTQTQFQLLTHGGPDIRYDYTDFLKMRGGALCFWLLTEKDCLKTSTIQRLFHDLYSFMLQKNLTTFRALELHASSQLAYGFLWNDIINFNCRLPISKIDRGESCIALNTMFIQHFLELFTCEDIRIAGLIRGHQHCLPKIIGGVDDGTPSPSCVYFTSNSSQWHLLSSMSPATLHNTFSIVTVISGQIQDKGGTTNYLPTLLELRFDGNDTYTIEAIEHN